MPLSREERHSVAEWTIEKTKHHHLSICCLQGTDFRYRGICRWKVRGWRTFIMLKESQSKSKTVTKDEEGHCLIIINVSIQQED